jgi:CheY-like chemotaxis protein
MIMAENMLVNEQGWKPVRISVKDTGQGIRKEDIPKLFVPFERIGAENTETEGTGLGLAVVKKLVELMGGQIGVESEPGAGALFWIELPEAESQLNAANLAGFTTEKGALDEPWTGLILYIEDNKPNIDLVQDILDTTRPGIRLITTLFGKKAVGMAREYAPDLILLDLNLPDIHGSDVLRMLKTEPETQSIPVVVITADAVHAHIKPTLQAGALDYLIKPLDIDNFLSVLDKIFHKK